MNKLGTTGVSVDGAITQENAVFYNKNLLKRLVGELVWARWGQKKSAPKRSGDTVSFRRFESLTPSTEPLEEGVTPDGKTLTVTDIRAVVKQYGDYIEITDKLDLMGIDPVLTEASEILGEMAGLLMDGKARDVLCAGTTVQRAGGRETRNAITTADKISSEEVMKAVKTLKKNKVKRIDGYYIGIIDPDAAYDLMNDPLWQDVSKYNGGEKIMKGELGRIHGVRFFETPESKIFAGEGASSIDVHATVILGKDAYGITDVEGSSKPEMIIKDFGSAGTADPLDQRATAGYKMLFEVVRLQELAMLRIEHAVS